MTTLEAQRQTVTEAEFRDLARRDIYSLLKQSGSYLIHPRTQEGFYGVPHESRSQTKFMPRVQYHRTSNRIVKGKGFITSGNKITVESLQEELDGQRVSFRKIPTWKSVWFTRASRCK
jgi:hypothetical protein